MYLPHSNTAVFFATMRLIPTCLQLAYYGSHD